ncbi:MAG: MATE family efflux transporter [Gammaproteobacteria bacterium]
MSKPLNLTEGHVGPTLLRLTAPVLIGIGSVISISVADTWFISRLGTTELAAMGFIGPVVHALAMLAIGLGAGASSLLSRRIGAQHAAGEADESIPRLATDALWLAATVSLTVMALGLLGTDPLFRALGAGPEVMPHIHDFMGIWFMGVLFMIIPMVANNLMRATGDTAMAARIMLTSAFLNLLLDPLLIFGLAGFPRLEMQGAALATVLARFIAMVVALVLLHRRKHLIDWRLPRRDHLLDHWNRLLRLSGPAALSNMAQPLGITVIVSLVALSGAEAVAGFGAATRVEALSFVPAFALALGLTPFIGQNWGAGRIDRAQAAFRWVLRALLLWGLLLAVLCFVFAPALAALFSDEPAVRQHIQLYLRWVPWTWSMDALAIVAGSAWLAMGRPLLELTMMAGRFVVVYIPLAFVLSRGFGFEGILMAAITSNMASGLFAWVVTRRLVRAPG